MEKVHEIQFRLALFFSIVLHLFLTGFIAVPYIMDPAKSSQLRELFKNENSQLRDVIVNINADDLEIESPYTLFSERSSSAQGHMSEDKGDTWLNNSQTFSSPRQSSGKRIINESLIPQFLYSKENATYEVALSRQSESEHPIIEILERRDEQSRRGNQNEDMVRLQENPSLELSEWAKIPDIKGFTPDNALFLSSDRRPIAFNTKKFQDFEYFRNMKQQIGNNWFPPTLSNMRHYYAGGYTQSRLIASQEVYLYFVMNRAGDVLSVKLVQSKGNQYLDQSCIDAVTNSKNFGPVPASIEGEKIVIPFIFGFYVR